MKDDKQVYEDSNMKITVELTERGKQHPKLRYLTEMMVRSIRSLVSLYPTQEYETLVAGQLELIRKVIEVAEGIEGDDQGVMWPASGGLVIKVPENGGKRKKD